MLYFVFGIVYKKYLYKTTIAFFGYRDNGTNVVHYLANRNRFRFAIGLTDFFIKTIIDIEFK